jgi:hypothetical protein
MKKWEDIVKDKLEGYESALPEGSLAAFQARRSAAISDSGRKRLPLIWVFAAAVAAGVAAFLFLRQTAVPGDAIQIIGQPANPVATAADSAEVSEPVQTSILIAQSTSKKETKQPAPDHQEFSSIDGNEPEAQIPAAGDSDELNEPVVDFNVGDTDNQQDTVIPIPEISTPFVPEMPEARPIGMKIGPAASIVGGSGLLIALWANRDLLSTRDYSLELDYIRTHDVCVTFKHYIPVKTGISARFPLSERLNITTGLEYSQYTSVFDYSLSGKKLQKAHYLGVPLRLDWTFASNNWLDVYVGGGIEGSYCLGATLNGTSIPKDGFGFTLLGAGGLQWKITKSLGLYLEPEIGWTNPSFTNPLQTYRTDYPVEFSITSGIRFTFGK